MPIVIIPDYLYDEVTKMLEIACKDLPEMSEADLSHLRSQIWDFVDKHGYIPEFSVTTAG